ncbi:MAG: bifunctional diaminohydroxyphosphoribosylaminopyrimidine deaminase/5-amino-6-(5-phosphoribosylamino)uracil reductase RibD [Verrucomicrobiota bacterium]
MTTQDIHFMKLAIKQAKKGLGLTSPNPPVGAIIVDKNGTIIGKGYHHRAGEAHAEINAIHNSLKKYPASVFKNATLYVTLEPCSSHGNTGACTDAIIQHQFSRVVYACSDPNPQHQGRAKRCLMKKNIPVTDGILNKEAQHLIRYFTKSLTTGLPWVIAKSAMTLDARTTLPPGQGPWITSSQALEDVQRLRSQIDAILIGGATLRHDNPHLTLRGKFARNNHPQPARIISTLSGDFPQDSHVFTDPYRDKTQVFTKKSLRFILKKLAKQGIQSVMIESGGKLLANALKNDLIDEVVFYYAPIIGGGCTQAIQSNDISKKLSSIQMKKLGPDIRISGLIQRS